MMTATRFPSTSSRICADDPNMVCYLMKDWNLCTEKTNKKVTKIKCWILLRDTISIFWRALLTKIGEKCTPLTSFFNWKNVTAKDRNVALKFGDIETTRDYAERLKFEFDNEIMSENFVKYW